MTLLRLAQNNPTLKGHQLLLLSPWTTPQDTIDTLRAKFPDLDVLVHQQAFDNRDAYAQQAKPDWKDVTILLTGGALPDIGDAPKLQYVQLVSAGANHIVEKPIFRDTEIPFCTANGVHGRVLSSCHLASENVNRL